MMRHLMILSALSLCHCQYFAGVDDYAFGEGGFGGTGGGVGGAGGLIGAAGGGGRPTSTTTSTAGGGGSGGLKPECDGGPLRCEGEWLLACGEVGYEPLAYCPDDGRTCIVDACEAGLLGRWRFDEGAGSVATDDAAQLAGALVGDASWQARPDWGTALGTGDSGHVDVGDVFNGIALPLTLAAWVYVEPSATSTQMVVVALDSSPATGYAGAWLSVNAQAGTVAAGFGDAGGTGPSDRHGKSADGVTKGEWVHLAAVIGGPNDVTLYVDGVDVGGGYSGTASSMAFTAAPMLIGQSWWGGYDGHFDGRIDEVRVYGRALEDLEVAELAAP